MNQKIIRVGTSLAVVMPKQLLERFGLRQGDPVTVSGDSKLGFISITTTPRPTIDKELLEWTDHFIEKYRPALEALAKK